MVGVSQYYLSGSPVGVEPGALGAGEDLTHCWALRDQTPLCLLRPSAPGGCEAVVGWLFVNWIVDASICGSSSP